MSRLLPTLLACALGAIGLASAHAAPPTAAAGAGDSARQGKLDRLDTNQDGMISRAEYQAWVDQRYARLDPSGKGRLDANDLVQSPAFQERAQARAERMIKRYDRSGTGTLDRADFEAAQMARFDRLADGKDAVSTADLKAARHGRGQRGHVRHGSDAAGE